MSDHSESEISGRMAQSNVIKVLSHVKVLCAWCLEGGSGPVSLLGENCMQPLLDKQSVVTEKER